MKIGMLFPDYGSQYVGMGKELYDNSRLVQEYFEEAFNCLNINFVKLCFASSDAELAKLENSYVSIFLISVAIAALLKQENIVPSVVAGYGIGELSATCTAEGLSFPDGLYFLNKYAQFYQELLSSLDVSIIRIEGISSSKLTTLCKELSEKNNRQITIASFEADTQQIVSGYTDVIHSLKDALSSKDVVIRDLPVEKGLHSSLMDPVVEQLIKYLEKIDFKNLTVPLIANVDGLPVMKKELVKRRIVKQIQSPILWNKILQHSADWDIVIEIGPGSTLSKIIQQKYPDKHVFSINKFSDIEELQKFMKQLQSI
jgi:[acyl-carrier-protein] S-malonyltransferase